MLRQIGMKKHNHDAPASLEALMHSYYPAVLRLAASILAAGDGLDVDAEAEDAAQETFIAAARGLDGFQGEASPKTWLFAIAINVCRSRLRRRKAQQTLSKTLANLQRIFLAGEPPQALERQAETAERDRALWAAVERLEAKHRMVIVLRYVHDLSTLEIAQVLGVNEGTVYSRLHYARQQLLRSLKRSFLFQEARIP